MYIYQLPNDTYFNSFSIGKWKKYTTLSSLSLVLLVKGIMKINVYHLERKGTKIKKQNLIISEVTSKNSRIEIPEKIFSDSYFQGLIAFTFVLNFLLFI